MSGFHDSESGVLFAGDAIGVRLPDAGVPAAGHPTAGLRPGTWPCNSLQKFAARRPSAMALAHYGLLESPEELLAEADDTLRQWAETAEAAFREGTDIAEALAARFDASLQGVDPAHREKLETLNGVHSNAAGFRRWLEGRDAAS